jgi:hypothetical protein
MRKRRRLGHTAGGFLEKAQLMAFMVNSSPGAGFRFEPSATFADAKQALEHAAALARRGMRQIRIRDTESGQVFDEKGLRQHLREQRAMAQDEKTE